MQACDVNFTLYFNLRIPLETFEYMLSLSLEMSNGNKEPNGMFI